MLKYKKKILFLIFGNLIEFYDFTLYAFLAPTISTVFFPHDNKIVSLFAALGAFASSYFARPLGALYFGRIGDRSGRKKALCNAIVFTGVPTLIIALTPGYKTIGILAPLTLILSRLLQGICTGGEFSGISVFLIENCRNEDRGIICGFINSSIVAGMLLGTFVSISCSFLASQHFWRIPFLIGFLITVLGYMLRKKIKESPLVLSTLSTSYISYPEFFKNFYKSFLSGIFVSGFAGAMFYTSFVYPNIYLTVFKAWGFRDSLIVCSAGMFVYAVSSPFAGKLVYQKGIKNMMLIFSVATCSCIYPIFYLLNIGTFLSVSASLIALSLLSSFFQACVNIFLVSSFPVEVRHRGVGLSYCVGLAIWGGTVTPILIYFKEKNLGLMMGGYICFIAILSFFAVYFSDVSIYSKNFRNLKKRNSLEIKS